MAKYYFDGEIDGWDSWCKIFHSVEVWKPLVNFILEKESLPVSQVENLHPGSNAVFKSGEYVVKIFAPKKLGANGSGAYKTEKFGMSFAYFHGVTVPKLIASGEINDKYDFPYMVMDYIKGVDFTEASEKFSDGDKFMFGKRMRDITDKMNKPCKNFNRIDVKKRHRRWNKIKFSERFKAERLEYLKSHDFGEKVFIHGDLCEDNILIDAENNIYIIDFADSVKSPRCYEHAHLASSGLFNFDKAYLRGYFGDYKTDELLDICFDGILLHDFGAWIIDPGIAKTEDVKSLKDFREALYERIK